MGIVRILERSTYLLCLTDYLYLVGLALPPSLAPMMLVVIAGGFISSLYGAYLMAAQLMAGVMLPLWVWHTVVGGWFTLRVVVLGHILWLFSIDFQFYMGVAMHTAIGLMCIKIHQHLDVVQPYFAANVCLIGVWLYVVAMPFLGFTYGLQCVVRMQKWLQAHPEYVLNPLKEKDTKKHVIVVGNGPLPDGVGEKIDEYDDVVRFNKYNKNRARSGKKVTYHFMSSSWGQETPKDVICVQSMANGSLTHAMNVFLPHLLNAQEILAGIEAGDMHFLSRESLVELRAKLGIGFWQLPTSGMSAIQFFTESYAHTTITGFSFFKTGARTYENALDFINSIVCMIELSFTHSPPKEKIFVEKHYGHMLTKLGDSPKQSPRAKA